MSISIVNPKRLEGFLSQSPPQTRRVFIVGASGAGKSTLWKVLRSHSLPQLAFPTRLISRATRPDDDLEENQQIDTDKFAQNFISKQIDFYWPKYLPDGPELYGFMYCNAPVVIYGCNNEFILNSDSLVSNSDLHANSIVILVTCSPEQRTKRLAYRYRSHLIPSSELKYRLATAANESKIREASDLVLGNETEDMSASSIQLLRLLNL